MLFAVLGRGVMMTRSRHLPFLQLGQGLGTQLQFLFSCCYQLSPYINCHHFAWKDNLLAA